MSKGIGHKMRLSEALSLLAAGGFNTVLIARQAQYEADVLRVCMVYPHPVSSDRMQEALQTLGYDPKSVYIHLAEGYRLPDLDEVLLGPGR